MTNLCGVDAAGLWSTLFEASLLTLCIKKKMGLALCCEKRRHVNTKAPGGKEIGLDFTLGYFSHVVLGVGGDVSTEPFF